MKSKIFHFYVVAQLSVPSEKISQL